MPRRLPAVAIAALMLLAAPPAAGSSTEELGCGSLAPAGNECVDPDRPPWRGEAEPGIAILGFVGRLDLILEQFNPRLGITVRNTWVCEAVLFEAPPWWTPACTGPTISPAWAPPFVEGLPVTLRCRTWPLDVASPMTAGPWGPWGCSMEV